VSTLISFPSVMFRPGPQGSGAYDITDVGERP
jgi:hypothetical protein